MNGGSVIFKFIGDSKELEKTSTSVGDIIKGSLAAKGISKALGIINDNMGDAVKRVDQLNQFPKVMQALGISSDDSAEAIELINSKILGLPTTLNQATTAVQRFTAKNGDVKTSAKYFTAINDALLSGTSDTTIYSNALEQVMQAYSKGKPDMMEWRSMLTAMPAQLKQVSQAFGYVDTDDLYEALKNGEVSMDDFLAMVVKLDNEGSNGMASFSDSVKDSVGGIGTNMTNLHTAITRGLANTIETLNETLSSQGLPTISEAIANSTTKINSAFKVIQEIISKIDFNKVILAFKTLVPLFISFKVGTKTFEMFILTAMKLKDAQKMLSAITSFVKPLVNMSGAVKGTTSAISILSKVLKLPLGAGLIVAGITALVTGFILLWNTSEGFRNFWIGLWNGIVNIVSGAVKGIKTFFNNIINFIKNNWQGVLLFLVNPIAGGFKLLYDNCAGFRNFINKFVSAIVGFFSNLGSSIGNIFKSIGQFFSNAISNIGSFFSNVGSAIVGFITSIPGAIVSFFSNLGSMIVSGLSEIGKNVIIFLKAFPQIFPKLLGEIIYYIGYGIGALVGIIATFIVKTLPELLMSLGSFLATFFTQTLPTFFTNCVLAIATFFTNVGTAIITFFTTTLPELFVMGLTAIQTFFSNVWARLVQFVTSDIPTFFANLWETLSTAFISGLTAINDFCGMIINAIISFFVNIWNYLSQKIPEILQNALNFIIALPGRIWNILVSIVSSIWSWGSNMAKSAWQVMSNVANTIVGAIQEIPSQLLNIGKWMVEGLWNGINNAKDWIKNKIKSFCEGIADGFKKFFQIGSPSKMFFKFGGYIDQGFINGIESLKDEAQTSVTGLVDPNSLIDMSPSLFGSASTNLSPVINVTNDINVETDPLGQVVQNVKTFSGGAKNDYNYGMGV